MSIARAYLGALPGAPHREWLALGSPLPIVALHITPTPQMHHSNLQKKPPHVGDPKGQRFTLAMASTPNNQGVTLTHPQCNHVGNRTRYSDGQGTFPTLYAQIIEKYVHLNFN